MSNGSSSQSRTEQPTSKKLRDARKQGDVWHSKDVGATASIVLAQVLFALGGTSLVERLGAMLTRTAGASFNALDDTATLLAWTRDLLTEAACICAAVALLMAALAALTGWLQAGAVFSLEPVMPRLSRLNPVEGAKRLFALRNLVGLVKLAVICIALAAVLWWVAHATLPALVRAQWLPVGGLLPLAGKIIGQMAWMVTLAFVAMSVFDIWFQRMEYLKRHKMTKDEVRREAREMEGSPEMRGMRRRLHHELGMGNMLENVRKANVVVVNPTHIAVALYYEAGVTDLPLVVAKGEGHIAQAIRDIAQEEGIPIMRNVKLARGLHAAVQLNTHIPDEFLEPVAEVLRWVRDFHGRLGEGNE
ncbi:EscU/YscU/HrcU family type III secretion system export apparatus switch protein [Pseudoduganella eburnea]|uniref:EscU/YscU/HrcU family type III secretion system export apparatus switch protein n=1 Tax=Massilia eburnea TaxID=1776165 RepID=A0A6L6QL33_9BURK|nr:EscU/YscU/HrcU family type III secretion system export apparatus switch protein [Massilia eburnea]MTW12637.1 EscU/YscU/HrcU family type III secretion system export apparatus switch protein [Massilia eburnea]